METPAHIAPHSRPLPSAPYSPLQALKGLQKVQGAAPRKRGILPRGHEKREVAEAPLVARGDLSVNFGLKEVRSLQVAIAEKALELRKPVIVATQLLGSMIEKPVPTRAEVVDVGTAVELGVDALMLAGETSVGKYPLEAVSWLARIVGFAEKTTPKKRFSPLRLLTPVYVGPQRARLEEARSALRRAANTRRGPGLRRGPAEGLGARLRQLRRHRSCNLRARRAEAESGNT